MIRHYVLCSLKKPDALNADMTADYWTLLSITGLVNNGPMSTLQSFTTTDNRIL